MSNSEITADIVIVGAGMVGLSLALSLSGSGLDIILLDAASPPQELSSLQPRAAGQFSPRVSAITHASRQLLQDLGAWQDIQALGPCAYTRMCVWDADGTGRIAFDARDIHVESLGNIVENNMIASSLHEQATTVTGLRLLYNNAITQLQLDEDRSSATGAKLLLESGQSIQTPLVIGTDGANSMIRQLAGFQVREWDYEHTAIVTTVETEKAHQFTAWQRFMPDGPLAFLPLRKPGSSAPEQHFCSIVWSCKPDRAGEVLALDDAGFRVALGSAFEHTLGDIVSTDPRVSFPLRQRHSLDYVKDHVVLAGDAAHTIHPLAGQGVNLGFSDVMALSACILHALEADKPYYSAQTLSRYQRQRKGPNLGMMAVMEGFKQLFGSNDLTLRWLRNRGLAITDNLPMVKQALMQKAMGL